MIPLPNVDPSIFRAYDIRGIVGRSLTPALAYHLGRAYAAIARERAIETVFVAADGRLSGPELKQALSNGLVEGGCAVTDIGYVPTPLLYFAASRHPQQSGIMVTGSHNPADYNGFKLMLDGETLSGEAIQQLRQRIEQRAYSSGAGRADTLAIDATYLQRVCDDVQLQRPLKLVVDCGNGIAGRLAPELFSRLGCDVIPLFCEVDGHFPNHHPDPGKLKNLQDLIATVRATGADLGVAFDGDGDRAGLVTDTGKVIYADRLLMLLAEDLLQRRPGATILYDVKCSRLLPQLIVANGGQALMCQTGHSLIKRRMKETGALLAGEMSGHLFIKERWYGFDDGLYSAARLLEILAARPEPVARVFSAYPEDISTPELQIEVAEANKFAIVDELRQYDFPGGAVSQIDGIRVDYDDGWGLVRASNTTPVLVLRFEASSESALARIRNEFQTRLHSIDASLDIPHD